MTTAFSRSATGNQICVIQEEELADFDLLITLKREKLVLDWRKRQQTRAEVQVTIEKLLDTGLPRAYAVDD